MILFISPAKTFRKSNIKPDSAPMFHHESEKIINKLKKLSKKDIKTKMKVSDKVAEQTYNYYQHFNENLQPAIFSYFGHQYRHIKPDEYSKADLKYIQNHLYIMSGLYGLLKPLDHISFYRLEMQDQTVKNLYNFWMPLITTYLNTNHKDDILINLASKEYGQIIEKLEQTYTIEFYQIKNGKPYIHSMEAKMLRGLMTSHIIKNQISTLDDLKKIIINNYTYDRSLSKDRLITFTKEI